VIYALFDEAILRRIDSQAAKYDLNTQTQQHRTFLILSGELSNKRQGNTGFGRVGL